VSCTSAAAAAALLDGYMYWFRNFSENVLNSSENTFSEKFP
jgi:hypothetical protein